MNGPGRMVFAGSPVVTAALFAVGLAGSPADRGELLVVGAAAVLTTAVGTIVVLRLPRHRVAWLLMGLGLLPGGHVAARVASRAADSDAAAAAIGWWATWTLPVWLVLSLAVLPLVFPDGRLPSRRWSPVAALTCLALALALVPALLPGPLELWDGDAVAVDNPLGVPALGGALAAAQDGFFPLLMTVSLLAVASLFARYRAGDRDVRQQLRWVLAAVAAYAVALLLDELPAPAALAAEVDAVTSALALAAAAAVPIAMGAAVLRYRLYDLDIVLSRVLVHGCLLLVLTASYVAAVTSAGMLLGDTAATPVGLVALAMTALALQPLRVRLQRRVNQMVFGFRDDPAAAAAVLSDVRARTQLSEDLLHRATEAVGHALRVESVTLEALHDGRPVIVASVGPPPTPAARAVPVTWKGELLGRLLLHDRSRRLTHADEALLARLAVEVGGCLDSVRTTEALEASRAEAVTAREEERRRLRNDLHDGLGQALTGVVLKAQAAAASTPPDVPAQRFMTEVEHDARVALGDVRRLLASLRPPALDELGLAGALERELTRVAVGSAPELVLELDDAVDAVPAAVEVAAYRIVLEAVHNARRHSRAGRCTVRLSLSQDLHVEVVDDGTGMPDAWRPGIGLASIRARTEELGGSWALEPAVPHGTAVRVRLPVKT